MFKFAFIMVALSFLVGCQTAKDSKPSAQYCDMTQIYADTGGEYGWPDYKKIAEEC